ncbi:PepSY domain-containing protein [Oceanisphaera pacifica]|uniref:PepSY domain-containing protein n=1 Tax=Oceanisphaera pacifica TaxID=2818389 RepID=A0ABS3NGZ2_9GAMM|nr:PepSY domain-containing protein [Oceanisphaera pacifica]MBO1519511.1 PepSY domain-containing protein [Oceanisphaera pacifica]
MSNKVMKKRVVHKVMGILLVIPLVVWAFSGAIFFIKPGYQAAFAPLMVKTYPLDADLSITPDPQWQELRLLKTVLGEHLLVTTASGPLHVNAHTLLPMPVPSLEQLHLLLSDAIAQRPMRYGELTTLEGGETSHGYTSTGVKLTLNWPRLQLQQAGTDTRVINGVYRLHYLQWTPYERVNQILGFVGLALLLGLALSGVVLLLRSSPEK